MSLKYYYPSDFQRFDVMSEFKLDKGDRLKIQLCSYFNGNPTFLFCITTPITDL